MFIFLGLLGSFKRKASNEVVAEVKNLRSALSELHLKHRSLAMELFKHQDADLKNKAELKYLQGNVNNCDFLVRLPIQHKQLFIPSKSAHVGINFTLLT